MKLQDEISACRLCAGRFAATATQHYPRPVVWFRQKPRILVAGQAPGMRVHNSGIPFDDRSGDRLRDWMGIDRDTFYDRARISIVPMAFCFPGYDQNKSDLPPPQQCSDAWHERVVAELGPVPLMLIVGGYAHRWHLGSRESVTDTVAAWADHAPTIFPLPHPSWRNSGWLRKNPWFTQDLLPALRARVSQVLA